MSTPSGITVVLVPSRSDRLPSIEKVPSVSGSVADTVKVTSGAAICWVAVISPASPMTELPVTSRAAISIVISTGVPFTTISVTDTPIAGALNS
ncbi:hypothetical protein FALB51S_00853 [Frigidibacter albus]